MPNNNLYATKVDVANALQAPRRPSRLSLAGLVQTQEEDERAPQEERAQPNMSNSYRQSSTTSIYMDDDFRNVVRDMQDENDSTGRRRSNPRKLEWSLRSLRRDFQAKNTEVHFKRYQQRLTHRFFTVLLILSLVVYLFDICCYFISWNSSKFPFPVVTRLAAMIIFAAFLCKCCHDEKWLFSRCARLLSSLIVFVTMLFTELSGIFVALGSSEMDAFNWKRARPIYFLIMVNQILLPFPSRAYSLLASLVVVCIELIITFSWPHLSDQSCRGLTPHLVSSPSLSHPVWSPLPNWYVYLIADITFYLLAFLVSFYVNFLLEIVNRRAFLDHRKCVESKYTLTDEKEEQERLLGSCLPRHLMQMVQDDIYHRFAFLLSESSSMGQNDRDNSVDSNNNLKHGSSISRPFKDLYIDKHECVTILYADIVNSMLLTDSLRSPKALIETLNDLFGRFDHQAEVYNCLRIKLLGDCYYCVSGIPVSDLRHADNCLRMGLDMIEIIKKFREINNIQIDMRIGIHTGKVLSGLLGLKKWQYDIWSMDAMKASTMEHNGRPGFVHITKETLDLISNNTLESLTIMENHAIPNETTYLIQRCSPTQSFQISPSSSMEEEHKVHLPSLSTLEQGDAQTVMLRKVKAGHNIVRVPLASDQTESIVPISASSLSSPATSPPSSPPPSYMPRSFSQTSLPRANGLVAHRTSTGSSLANTPRSSGSHAQERRRTVVLMEKSVYTFRNIIRSSNDSLSKTIDEMPFNLKKQYNLRNGAIEIHPLFLYFIGRGRQSAKKDLDTACDGSLSRLNQCWQSFGETLSIDWTREKAYFNQSDPLYPYYLLACAMITLVIILIRFLAMYDSHYISHSSSFWYETGNFACYVAFMLIVTALALMFGFKKTFSTCLRVLFFLSITLSLVLSTLIDMNHCSITETQETEIANSDSSIGKACLYKWSRYYTYSCILSLSAISLFIHIPFWLKFVQATLALLAIVLVNYLSPCSIFTHVDQFYESERSVEMELFTPTQSHIQYLFIVYLLFLVFDRQVEYISRLDFLWASKLKLEEYDAKIMREMNKQLLKNILPIHLADKFLQDPEQRHTLYYEPYESCAVMFAAMPNFVKFYSENKKNDDGLQCLYVLNEIISEFDKLLLLPDYKDKIEKIKTIGSTYMAAAGLHPGRASIDSSVTIEEETKNLANLIRFAMSMIKVLRRLNESPKIKDLMKMSSSRSSAHLKLRVGISMGPVIAGVVGALKPQYDIWGDTVNVASRMDTSGLSNKIHLPESVANNLVENGLFRPYSRGVQHIKGKGQLATFLIDYDPYECPD